MRCAKVAVLLCTVFLCANAKVTDEQYASMPELFHLDDFDRCLMLGKKALYCIVQMQLVPIETSNTQVWQIIQELISNKKNYRHDWLRYGICVPTQCPNMEKNISSYINNVESLKELIGQCYSSKLKHLGLTTYVTEIECETEKPLYDIDGYDIAVGIALITLVIVVLFASFYEGSARYKSKDYYDRKISTKYGKIIACFSIPKNWDRLTQKSTSPDAKSLRVINGGRFYTMLLVITVHICMVAFVIFPSNPQFAETMTEDPLNILFLNGSYGVQTFLVLAGWLLSYHFFLTFEKRPKFKLSYILYAFIHRYIRLTTCLAVMIAINATWLQHINRGPFWNRTVGPEYRNCRKNWWTNLLYINNYYDTDNMCLLQTWYLAADTQLFLYSLILLAIIWKYKEYVYWIFGFSMAIGLLIPGIQNYIYDYDAFLRQYPEYLYKLYAGIPEFSKAQIPGHCNIGGYTIGLISGYLFYKNRNKKLITKKYQVAIWWVIIWTLPLSVLFLGIPLYDDNYIPSRLGAAIYVAIARNMYALGITIGIYGISENVGWLLRDAVVIPPVQFLGRISYCVYLVHSALIRARSGQSRSKSYMTIYTFVFNTSGELIVSYIFATILCLFVELPTSALQKLMIPQLKKDTEASLKNQYIKDDEITKKPDLEISKV